MPTERLYFQDPYLTSFRATVLAHGRLGERPALALSQSAFYPEGGGQPADRGSLAGLPVADVQAAGELVWHALEAAPELLPAVGAEVAGAIDWARRQDHMQQHCGQHLLTAAFLAAGGPPTISFHLGAQRATIDLASPELDAGLARRAEDLANRWVWQDLEVRARFVGPDELARLPLRKPPSVVGPVRVVSIGEVDHSACGGTHPGRSGGVGLIAVLGWSRQRGGVRVEFACGGRALAELRRLGAAAAGASAALSVGVDELPEAAARQIGAQRQLARELEQARSELVGHEAAALYQAALATGAPVVCAALAGADVARLRALAQAVAAHPGAVAILGAPGERAQIVVACAADSGRDARALLGAGLGLIGGRGGGGPGLAQGGGPGSAGLEEALAAIRAAAGPPA